MLPSPENRNCYEYLKYCTSIYDDVWMLQHFGVKYKKSEVFAEIDALSAYFQNGLGLKRGDVFTVFMTTTMQGIMAFYALSQIGVIANLVHPLMSTEFLAESMTFTKSKGVMILDLLSKDHVKTINDAGVPCIIARSSDHSEGIKRIGTRAGESIVKGVYPKFKKAVYYADIVKDFMARKFEPAVENADDIACYMNGGGTTGKCKTIKLSNRTINEVVQRMSELDEIHIPGEEAEIVVLPMFHCFGLCVGIHMALCNSARVIPMLQFDARLFNRLSKKNLVVGYGGIPLMFAKLMNEKHFDGPWMKNIRLMFCGGDDVTDSFMDKYNSHYEKWGAVGRMRAGYGLTETASVVCTNTNTDYRPGSVGKPINGVKVEMWDDDCNPVPAGQIGEICISGPTIMTGYLTEDGPEDAGLYTDENGVKWVRSGDLGFIDEDGYIFFAGRKKRVVIIAGYNVYCVDIDKKLAELPFIKEACAVQGWQGERSIVRLYVTLKENGDKEEYKRIICETLESTFSKFYVPKEIIFIREMPETPLMKVDFLKLTQQRPGDPVYK